MANAADLEALRKEVTDLIKLQRRAQALGWAHMANDVQAARDKVTDTQQAPIERRLQELAALDYPTLLESALGPRLVGEPWEVRPPTSLVRLVEYPIG